MNAGQPYGRTTVRRNAALISLCFLSLACMLGAQTWDPDVRLTNDPYSSVDADGAFWLGNIHVVWVDERDGNEEIYYKRSLDNGQTWGSDMRLTSDSDASRGPSIAVSGDNVHVVWYDYRDGDAEIYYKRSLDNGANWSVDIKCTSSGDGAYEPAISVIEDTIHLVWYDFRESNFEIFYKRSLDNGQTWVPGMRLTNDVGLSFEPAIGCSGSNVFVVWTDSRSGNDELYYRRSLDSGGTWGSVNLLTSSGVQADDSDIDVYGNNIHIVWRDLRDGNSEIYYRRSVDNGQTWEPGIRLTNDSNGSIFPKIAVRDTCNHVVWQDDRDEPYEIYYKLSSDGGSTWDPDIRLTTDTSYSEKPAVVCGVSHIHVVWADYRDGNSEIYYKHGTVGSAVEEEPVPMSNRSWMSASMFHQGVIITYGIPELTAVTLEVFDVSGRKVKTLVNSGKESGCYTVHWDGCSEAGEQLTNGVYFCRMQAGAFQKTEKLIFLR